MAPDFPSQAFNACVVIPVYNHSQHITLVVERLAAFNLPCILVDDGSESGCARTLDALAEEQAAVILLRLPFNSGKGVAVCHGLQYAWEQGYTHALQVDADGQHDLDDVPRFLASAQAAPRSVVSGWRDYQSMPGSRRGGRRLTDMWVCVHTLSRAIRDSMCGYRMYPLKETTALLSGTDVGARMDFDTDILVRLYWRGVSVINLPTAIVYRDDISSHFDLWRDNLRITWMHTRLFFGMLVRLPRLLTLYRR